MRPEDTRPDSGSWNRFWARERAGRHDGVSWSKRRICAKVSPYLGKGCLALDAGCGSGFFTRHFLDQGADVTAVDYSEEALAMTREASGGRAGIARADLTGQGLAGVLGGKRYDLIFSDGLLEHFSAADQGRILENLSRVLSDRGVVFTVVPNRWSPWQLIRPLMMPGIHEDPFVLSGLRGVHERAGLRVIAAGGMNVLPVCCSPEALGPVFGMLLYVVARRM